MLNFSLKFIECIMQLFASYRFFRLDSIHKSYIDSSPKEPVIRVFNI